MSVYDVANNSWGGDGIERASFHELIAYVSNLKPQDLSGCRILAPGAYRTLPAKNGSMQIDWTLPTFPCAHAENDKIVVHWQSAADPNKYRFSTKCFWLMRDYT